MVIDFFRHSAVTEVPAFAIANGCADVKAANFVAGKVPGRYTMTELLEEQP